MAQKQQKTHIIVPPSKSSKKWCRNAKQNVNLLNKTTPHQLAIINNCLKKKRKITKFRFAAKSPKSHRPPEPRAPLRSLAAPDKQDQPMALFPAKNKKKDIIKLSYPPSRGSKMPLRASDRDTIGGYFDSCDLLSPMLNFSQSVKG